MPDAKFLLTARPCMTWLTEQPHLDLGSQIQLLLFRAMIRNGHHDQIFHNPRGAIGDNIRLCRISRSPAEVLGMSKIWRSTRDQQYETAGACMTTLEAMIHIAEGETGAMKIAQAMIAEGNLALLISKEVLRETSPNLRPCNVTRILSTRKVAFGRRKFG
jgi:hypothetical protein